MISSGYTKKIVNKDQPDNMSKGDMVKRVAEARGARTR